MDICLARKHCRIDYTDDDDLLAAYITGARQIAENYLNRALITQTLQFVSADTPPNADGWPMLPLSPAIVVMPQWYSGALFSRRAVSLPRAPLQSVIGVSTGRWGQADTTLTLGTDYTVDAEMQPGRIRLHPNSTTPWPQDHLSVTYVAGYGDTAAAIPQQIIIGILWLTAWLYENRGDVLPDMPKGAEMLLTPHRIVTFGA